MPDNTAPTTAAGLTGVFSGAAMTNRTETAAILRQFNGWRRGDQDIPKPDPREIGEAIDAAVEMIERLELAESSVAWHQHEGQAMTDHAHELRRHARKIAHPAGDVPSVMMAAADEIERLQGVIAGLREDFETAHARMMTSAAAEREACAQIVERNAAACRIHSELHDILSANALAIRERGEI